MKTIIERVINGWLVVRHDDDPIKYNSDDPEVFVFSDNPENTENPEAESLSRGLWEAFGHLYQSKHEAGLCVDYKDVSRTQGDLVDKRWIVQVEHLDATASDSGVGELCIRLPDALVERLGWEIGDEIEWGETEICEYWGEHDGFVLSNLTKNPQDPQ
jgi:hypothetical protein